MCFMTFFIQKKVFLCKKNIDFKNSKICMFPKGLVHNLGQKFENFLSLYFTKNRQLRKTCLIKFLTVKNAF